MDIEEIRKLIGGGNETHINNYIAYIQGLKTQKKKGELANPWMQHRTPEFLARIYRAVSDVNLVFDGIDVTLQSTGPSFSYQAYKNRMFAIYPESIIDVGLVYKDDSFSFSKNSGKITYSHEISNPFGQKDEELTGAYCVIKNKRGEFLTTLTRPDIDKHRRVAKTDFIWKSWFVEMSMKTIIKKACKTHFKDSFTIIETLDNEQYDIDKLTTDNIDLKVKLSEEYKSLMKAKIDFPVEYEKMIETHKAEPVTIEECKIAMQTLNQLIDSANK